MKHTCHATGCSEQVPPRMFMCRKHWFLLPKAHRDAVWREYRPGQEFTKTPSEAYLDVADAAIAWLAQKEGKVTT